MSRPLDVLLVSADSAAVAYQDLSRDFSAIEPPTWALLLAQACRANGFGVGLLDCGAERLSDEDAVRRIRESMARLVCFVVYGQNPNSGTTNMVGATALARKLKAAYPETKTCFVGSHTSALPSEVLALPEVDFVLLNEGVYALQNLLRTEKLAEMGVRTLRVSDEMFFLNKNYYEPLVQGLAERQLGLRMWTYSRVDTVRPQYLEQFRRAGIRWLALGVEAGNQTVRREVSKGSFEDVNIRKVIRAVREAGLFVISNYIFGFPNEYVGDHATDAGPCAGAEHRNGQYVPLPGAARQPALLAGQNEWMEAPFVSERVCLPILDSQPLPTRHLSAAQVLKFRDDAWHTYFSNPRYLELVQKTFGVPQRNNVEAMARIRLRRKLLGDPQGTA